MENGTVREGTSPGKALRAWAVDAMGALGFAEGAVAEHVLLGSVPRFALRETNAFGDAVKVEEGGEIEALLERARVLAAGGARVALVAHADALASARAALRVIRAERLAVVVHALEGPEGALALADLGWGVLLASSVRDSLDMTLIARRAAEDSGTPFIVVHERALERHVEPLGAPTRELCEAFLGPSSARMRSTADAAHPAHAKVGARVFAERVPYALGSAMRELEGLTGRRHDVVERDHAASRGGNADSAVMLVAMGAIGDSLLAEAPRLRSAGHDVGAVKVTALRPFPGPRLVRALSRAVAVTVIESVDEPLAQSNFLTRELKAAFADALTWAPEYPGIGHIPRVSSGVIGVGEHVLDALDLDAIVKNVLEGERGKRLFVFGGGDADLALPAHPEPPPTAAPASSFFMRAVLHDPATADACAYLCSSLLGTALALPAHARVGERPKAHGAGATVELVASRDRARGVHRPHAMQLVVLDDAAALIHDNPLARLAHHGTVAVPTRQKTPEALWAEMPAYVKAIVFDREAHVVGYALPESAPPAPWLTAAAVAGLTVAVCAVYASAGGATPGRPAVDASLVAREVAEALRAMALGDGEALAERGGDVARRAFEGHMEVPRATVLGDLDAVRLGRRDERASGAR